MKSATVAPASHERARIIIIIITLLRIIIMIVIIFRLPSGERRRFLRAAYNIASYLYIHIYIYLYTAVPLSRVGVCARGPAPERKVRNRF